MSFCASVWRCGRQTQEQAFVPLYVTTALILIFGTSMLVQAMVVSSSSMENNLLVGDHVLVDKLAYAPPGVWSRHVLPYREIGRDIIVFRYPVNLDEYFVKRVIGVPEKLTGRSACARPAPLRRWRCGLLPFNLLG
jgi:signal peptidase I